MYQFLIKQDWKLKLPQDIRTDDEIWVVKLRYCFFFDLLEIRQANGLDTQLGENFGLVRTISGLKEKMQKRKEPWMPGAQDWILQHLAEPKVARAS